MPREYPCIITGCTRPAGVRGSARRMCIVHYNRLRRTGDPECNAEGCHRPIGSHGQYGYCARHIPEGLRS